MGQHVAISCAALQGASMDAKKDLLCVCLPHAGIPAAVCCKQPLSKPVLQTHGSSITSWVISAGTSSAGTSSCCLTNSRPFCALLLGRFTHSSLDIVRQACKLEASAKPFRFQASFSNCVCLYTTGKLPNCMHNGLPMAKTGCCAVCPAFSHAYSTWSSRAQLLCSHMCQYDK